ncbi:hypothetical protein [Vibrio harveyi]|uniref:hypothetical protein n=1 Tax=Vibrio harveyi TaxID=669 RepID=UPI0018F1640B|nr:hypothetical protein [Vibrio harveyi]
MAQANRYNLFKGSRMFSVIVLNDGKANISETNFSEFSTVSLQEARDVYADYLQAGYTKECPCTTAFEDRCCMCGKHWN